MGKKSSSWFEIHQMVNQHKNQEFDANNSRENPDTDYKIIYIYLFVYFLLDSRILIAYNIKQVLGKISMVSSVFFRQTME